MTTTRANGVENLPASIATPANIAIISLDTWKADLKLPSHYDCAMRIGKKEKKHRNLSTFTSTISWNLISYIVSRPIIIEVCYTTCK